VVDSKADNEASGRDNNREDLLLFSIIKNLYKKKNHPRNGNYLNLFLITHTLYESFHLYSVCNKN